MYFNEFDPFAAQWLRNLYPTATVDEKDIRDVQPADVAGFRRCHFFGGIGGWQYALDLAGWGDAEVWTGSCPCQPLSCAGQLAGEKDKRHLWPEFYRLISECKPSVVFGEQVASPLGREWLDGISLDLEELGYAVGASDLCAASQGAPHPRQRVWWVGRLVDADSTRRRRRGTERMQQERALPAEGSEVGSVANATGQRLDRQQASTTRGGATSLRSGNHGGVANTNVSELCGVSPAGKLAVNECDAWDAFRLIDCTDGLARRAERGSFPLAARIPRDLGQRFPELRPLAKGARANRVGRLRGYGNAIVPQVAATFIRAFMET